MIFLKKQVEEQISPTTGLIDHDELVIENAQLKTRVSELEQEIVELKARIDKLTKMLFGKKSEKSKKKVKTLTIHLRSKRCRTMSRLLLR